IFWGKIWIFASDASLKKLHWAMAKSPPKVYTDAECLAAFAKDGNREWLGLVLDRYLLLLLGVCLKYLGNKTDAEDAVQQVCLKALTEWEKYPVDYPKSWLYKVAVNHCLMQLRKTKFPVRSSAELPDLPENDEGERRLEKEWMLEQMAAGLMALNADQQNCLRLFYLEEKSYQEIVNSTAYTLLQVKSHIQNGKRNLKIFMEKKQTPHAP
ncbi:MAG: sigma-70 family RNA polymerase sigma factor, partial [Sphingobacteriia bacterium]